MVAREHEGGCMSAMPRPGLVREVEARDMALATTKRTCPMFGGCISRRAFTPMRAAGGVPGVPGRRLPLPSGQSLHPHHQQSVGGARLTRHQRGFKQFSRPVFPSPGAPGQNGNPLGFPPSFAPRRPRANDARRGGDRPSSTDLELHAQHHISRSSNRAFTHYVRPRVAPPKGVTSARWMLPPASGCPAASTGGRSVLAAAPTPVNGNQLARAEPAAETSGSAA
jgi:hypothetical protein